MLPYVLPKAEKKKEIIPPIKKGGENALSLASAKS
jgi:hypothetical protein